MRGSTAGLADCMLRGTPNDAYNRCLALLDILISCSVIAPLGVCFWRGTWNMVVLVLFQQNAIRNALACTAIGLFGQLLLNYYQEALNKAFHPNRHRLTYYIASRLYTYVFGLCCVFTWAGIWLLIAEYVTLEPKPMIILTSVSVICLCLLRALRNIFGVPFYVALDTPADHFTVRTMYQKVVSE